LSVPIEAMMFFDFGWTGLVPGVVLRENLQSLQNAVGLRRVEHHRLGDRRHLGKQAATGVPRGRGIFRRRLLAQLPQSGEQRVNEQATQAVSSHAQFLGAENRRI
jgi:hypothetical protein